MTHGSLFSGIGGFDLAAQWMGWENIFHCEWDEFGQKVLNYYWPEAMSYADITATDFRTHRGEIDVLTGGFPCQPYSQAGKRLGKEDDRHLWPEMLRAIREIQPTWVVGENVLGIVNWNDGLVFEEVQADLEGEGYEVQTYVLPAAGVNAPHRRYRAWFVAYSHRNGRSKYQESTQINDREFGEGLDEGHEFNPQSAFGSSADPASNRLQGGGDCGKLRGKGQGADQRLKDMGCFSKEDWKDFPTQSPICNGNDGVSERLDSITFPKWRNESIKAGGNAIVPQVALQIFKAIQQYEECK